MARKHDLAATNSADKTKDCSSRGVCFVAPSKTPGLTNSKLWGCRLMIACLCTPIVQGDSEVCTVTHGTIVLFLCM